MRTFNCGIGMIVVVAAGQAAQVAAVLQEAGETVTPIGRIVPRRDAGVIYRGTIGAMSTPRKRVAILISGRGSNMAALIEAAARPGLSRPRSSASSPTRPTPPASASPRRAASRRRSIARSDYASKDAHDAAIDAALAALGAEIVCAGRLHARC